MLIIGAGGLAKELVLTLEENKVSNFVFFDNVSLPQKELLFGNYKILHNTEDVLSYWKGMGQSRFHVAIGNSIMRGKVAFEFEQLGGELVTLASTKSIIGNHNVTIGKGVTVMQQAIISNTATIGKGCLVYYNATITHDVIIGEFCELSPGSILLGGCKIGAYTHIGSGSTVLPKINIGKRVIVAAGSVVKTDVPDDCLVAGVPATIKKSLTSKN